MVSESETLPLAEPPDDKDAEIAALKRRVAELEASQAKPKPPPVSLAPASTIPDELRRPPPSAVSSMHAVQATHAARLADLVGRIAPRRLAELLKLRGFAAAEWFAEYAMAQLAAGSPCETEPAWVAWVAPADAGDELAPLLLALWAADEPACRRALLALDPKLRGARALLICALPRPQLPQIERWAAERGDVALSLCEEGGDGGERLALPPAPLRPLAAADECWPYVLRPEGEAAEAFRAARAEAAPAAEAAAMAKLNELSARLLALDPNAAIEVAPAARPHAFTINEVKYLKHVVTWVGEVDGYTSIDEAMRVIEASCNGCC